MTKRTQIVNYVKKNGKVVKEAQGNRAEVVSVTINGVNVLHSCKTLCYEYNGHFYRVPQGTDIKVEDDNVSFYKNNRRRITEYDFENAPEMKNFAKVVEFFTK